jgi:hypothetical protein
MLVLDDDLDVEHGAPDSVYLRRPWRPAGTFSAQSWPLRLKALALPRSITSWFR